MANPSCNIDSMLAACSQPTNVTNKEIQAEVIYLMALILANIGGTDYTQQLTGQLYQDACTLTIGFDTPKLMAAEIAIRLNQATSLGIAVPSFQDRQTAIACLLNTPDDVLLRMKTLLLCALGVPKAYPQ